MTAFSGHTFLTQDDVSAEQVNELRRAIEESTRKLEEAQQRRLRTEEEIIKRTTEAEQRVDLMMEKCEIVNALQRLGHLMQSEMDLFEQLNGQSSPDRSERLSLQDRSESARIKASQLVAEILEVKQQIEEVEARYLAVEASLAGPTYKSERHRTDQ